jgi:hypothetical protein
MVSPSQDVVDLEHLNFTWQPDDKFDCILLSVIYICLLAVGGQARGKPRLPT